jgi:aspartyl-tRNA(Asn)/glutamyl-tRNA(Gln) amidotransferase subunit A
MRAAGAIILGKLALHEFAIGGPAFDLPFPPARNPWNTSHHPGGSSSAPAPPSPQGSCRWRSAPIRADPSETLPARAGWSG